MLSAVVLGTGFVALLLWRATSFSLPLERSPPLREAGREVHASEIGHLVRAYRHATQFAGCVLVAHRGTTTYERCYGDADSEVQVPNSPATKFSLGALAKPLTAYVAHALAREGALSLDDPVGTHLPELDGTPAGRARIGQLLRMRAGLPRDFGWTTLAATQWSDGPTNEAELLEEVADSELAFEPGDAHGDSNVGYVLLSILLSRVAERPWAELLEREVFDRFEMGASGVLRARRPVPGLARGHLPYRCAGLVGEVCLLELPRWDYSAIRGAGGVYSTVRDLRRWDAALRRLEQQRPGLVARHGAQGEGEHTSGWRVRHLRSAVHGTVRVQEQRGDDPGFFGYMARAPSLQAVVIVLSNTDHQWIDFGYSLPDNLRDLVVGRPYHRVDAD